MKVACHNRRSPVATRRPLIFNPDMCAVYLTVVGFLFTISGYLYTGTADGKILRIDLTTKTMETLVTLGPPPCGMLLGIISNNNKIFCIRVIHKPYSHKEISI